MTMLDTDQPVRVGRSPMRFRVAAGLLVAVLVLAGCGDDDDNEVSAEFTGNGCVYSGSTEFVVGDEIEITVIDVTEERMDVGFAVLKVPDGTTVAEVRENGIFEFVVAGEAVAIVPSEVTEAGTERVISGTLDVAGTWMVNCFVFGTGDPDGEDFPATTFEVVEQS
jgi:hypothetical protein